MDETDNGVDGVEGLRYMLGDPNPTGVACDLHADNVLDPASPATI